MSKIRFAPEEVILADLSPSRRSVVFPVLELVLVTGVVWMLVGLLDAHLAGAAVTAVGYYPGNPALVPGLPGVSSTALPALWCRRILLVLWVWVAWRRSLRRLVHRQRCRIILTDLRLVTASGDWRSRIGEVPLGSVVDARRRGRAVEVLTRFDRRPLRLVDVPYAAEFVAMLRAQAARRNRPVYLRE
ncbi:hypothetical protein [Corynebacterium neomassiliense]|uniref:hypothetical protein n=1 Tax=Corynebacterium neomassiliense TaxID=2079482 RepID=UPI0010309956|nr:hypothetical protein [Corynebacterium neomassiliense]